MAADQTYAYSTLEHITQDKEPRILVVGDIMIDREVRGKFGQPCWEAPELRRFDVDTIKDTPGGAANTAHLLAYFGAEVCLAGYANADFDELPFGCKVARRHINIMGRPTTRKTRYVDEAGKLVFRSDIEHAAPGTPSEDSRIEAELRQWVNGRRLDAIVVSDYAKGVVTPGLMDRLRTFKVPIVVDPKGNDFLKYGQVWAVKPNLKEYREAVGRSACLADWMITTEGDQGCTVEELAVLPGKLYKIGVKPQSGDPCGCGDAFTAMLAYGVALDPIRMLQNVMAATAAGACAVGRLGRPFGLGSVEKALQDGVVFTHQATYEV